jgi:hypothetical protein
MVNHVSAQAALQDPAANAAPADGRRLVAHVIPEYLPR